MTCSLFIWDQALPGGAHACPEEELLRELLHVLQASYAVVYQPIQAADPKLAEADEAVAMLQLGFGAVEELRAGILAEEAKSALRQCGFVSDKSDSWPRMQAMEDLACAGGAWLSGADGGLRQWVGYLAAYEGAACSEDGQRGWVREYLDGHVSLMRQLPGLCALQVHRHLDWLPEGARHHAPWLLRNSVHFCSREALESALQSSIRDRMFSHRQRCLPEIGRSFHGAVRATGVAKVTASVAGAHARSL